METNVVKPVVIEVILSGDDLVELSKNVTLLDKKTVANPPIDYKGREMLVYLRVKMADIDGLGDDRGEVWFEEDSSGFD